MGLKKRLQYVFIVNAYISKNDAVNSAALLCSTSERQLSIENDREVTDREEKTS